MKHTIKNFFFGQSAQGRDSMLSEESINYFSLKDHQFIKYYSKKSIEDNLGVLSYCTLRDDCHNLYGMRIQDWKAKARMVLVMYIIFNDPERDILLAGEDVLIFEKSNLTREFKKHIGMLPSEWRAMCRKHPHRARRLMRRKLKQYFKV